MWIELFRDSARLNWFILLSKFPIRYMRASQLVRITILFSIVPELLILYYIGLRVPCGIFSFLDSRFPFLQFFFFSLSRKWVMSISTQSRTFSSLSLRTHYAFYFITSTCGSSTCGHNKYLRAIWLALNCFRLFIKIDSLLL